MAEISVTDSFMELDENTRNCQNIETYDDCNTRVHLKNLIQECGCLPLSLRLSEKVKITSYVLDQNVFNNVKYRMICA